MAPRAAVGAVVAVVAVVVIAVVACSGTRPHEESLREPIEIESLAFPGRLWDPFLPPLETGRNVMVGAG